MDVDTTKSSDLHNELTEIPPALRIVLSLREDYLGFLEEAADRIPQILDHRFRLTPLSIEAAVEALTGPAEIDDNILQTKPFTYAPEAVTTIITYLSRRSGRPTTVTHAQGRGRWKSLFRRSGQLTTYTSPYVEPFQLQLICQRIEHIVAERQRSTSSALTITMKDIGGDAALRATLQNFYKQEIHALSSWRQRRAVRRLCEEYLISPEGRRLSIEDYEIHRQLKLPGEILRKLVDRRLLRSDQRADSTYYELSHDTLIEPVLASRRIRGQAVGLLIAIFGALLLLMIVLGSIGIIMFTIEKREYTAAISTFIVFALFGYVGVTAFRRGVRTLRRYSPHV
jgi:hypothetical protein